MNCFNSCLKQPWALLLSHWLLQMSTPVSLFLSCCHVHPLVVEVLPRSTLYEFHHRQFIFALVLLAIASSVWRAFRMPKSMVSSCMHQISILQHPPWVTFRKMMVGHGVHQPMTCLSSRLLLLWIHGVQLLLADWDLLLAYMKCKVISKWLSFSNHSASSNLNTPETTVVADDSSAALFLSCLARKNLAVF